MTSKDNKKQVMIVKPKTISPKDKEKLNKAGILVIEHPYPGDVRLITEDMVSLSGHDILMSAMKAIQGNFPKEKFTEELFKRMQENELKTK